MTHLIPERKGKMALAGAAAVVLSGIVACSAEVGDRASRDSATQDAVALDADGSVLGSVRFPTSCNEAAQPLLERGLALLHHMTYIRSKQAFLQAAEADPECAIAYWGAAMTHVHPLWPDTITPEAQESGQQLLEKAITASHSSDRERAYVSALQGYYRESNRSEIERLRAFQEGWSLTSMQNPDDLEASLFRALSIIATAGAADMQLENKKTAGAIAEAVKTEVPQHPG
ncbi:MAG: hypothetical protein MI725_03135, partial [Pirellulales bacterium]|nr:hypothetical protein [Pirellulales bacterium]